MTRFSGLGRWVLMIFTAAFLTACGETAAVGPTAPEPLGDFKLGYAVVVADNVEKGPFSRDATPDELEAAIKPVLESRLGAYQGNRFYHVSVTVEAYALAVPGIPIIASPKSALVISVNVWDDAEKKIITEERHRITILEAISAKSLFGSGLTQSKEEQLAGLSHLAVNEVVKWLKENEALFHRYDEES